MSTFYDAWISAQTRRVEAAMRERGRKGQTDGALYVIPSVGATSGQLVLADETPDGASDVVRFPVQGDRIMWVPYPHLHTLLHNACRDFPVLPWLNVPDAGKTVQILPKGKRKPVSYRVTGYVEAPNGWLFSAADANGVTITDTIERLA